MSDSYEPPEKSKSALVAAHLYFVKQLTMDAIARELKTSRSTVSRLISYAKDAGLVEIKLHPPADLYARLEKDIFTRYRVTAHVVPVTKGTSDIDRMDAVATKAGQILTNYFDSNMRLGVAWGSTIGAISRRLVAKRTIDSEIVQMNGAGNSHTAGVDYASEQLSRFGEAYGAVMQQFPVPTFFDNPDTKRMMWAERSTQRLLGLQARLDIAIFSVGAPFAEVPSHVYSGGYLAPADYENLQREGVVGDVATIFYRADGSSAGIEINNRASGPDLASIRRTPRRICVVSGMNKREALRGALAAGLPTNLVVDEDLAHALVDPR